MKGNAEALGLGRRSSRPLVQAVNTQPVDRVGEGAIYLAFGEAGHEAIRASPLAKGVTLADGWRGKRLMIVEDLGGNQLWFADLHCKHRMAPYREYLGPTLELQQSSGP